MHPRRESFAGESRDEETFQEAVIQRIEAAQS